MLLPRNHGRIEIFALCLTILISLFIVVAQAGSPTLPKKLNLTEVELADTAEKQIQGLMNRDNLCASCAMLFLYSYPASDVFWMKNTQISLDIIFMDKNGKILNIHKNTEPLNTEKLYSANGVYWFVLETNAGFAEANNLEPGDALDVKTLVLQTKKIDK